MAVYKLSGKASLDIDGIYEYTIVNFGVEQARVYVFGLNDCFTTLAENPLRGRSADEFASDIRRYEHKSHVIFYREMEEYSLIVRVLHKSMDLVRQV